MAESVLGERQVAPMPAPAPPTERGARTADAAKPTASAANPHVDLLMDLARPAPAAASTASVDDAQRDSAAAKAARERLRGLGATGVGGMRPGASAADDLLRATPASPSMADDPSGRAVQRGWTPPPAGATAGGLVRGLASPNEAVDTGEDDDARPISGPRSQLDPENNFVRLLSFDARAFLRDNRYLIGMGLLLALVVWAALALYSRRA